MSVASPGGSRANLLKTRRGQITISYRSVKSDTLSKEHPRTEMIYQIIRELFENGKSSVRPGDVNTVLRERNSPLGTWDVRAEFTRLEKIGRISCNQDTGDWHLTESASLQDAS
jgi:hypothetical protein